MKRNATTLLIAGREDAACENAFLLEQWLRGLYEHLLHKKQWRPEQHSSFAELVADIQLKWRFLTGTRVTPKVHMLSHAVSFAVLHGHLGRYSEAPGESYHVNFNRQMLVIHRNKCHDLREQMRRSLAQLTLIAVQPIAPPKAKML